MTIYIYTYTIYIHIYNYVFSSVQSIYMIYCDQGGGRGGAARAWILRTPTDL